MMSSRKYFINEKEAIEVYSEEAFYSTINLFYEQNFANYKKDLETAFGEKSKQKLLAVTRDIKNVVRMFCCEEVALECEKLEESTKEDDWNSIKSQWPIFTTLLDQLFNEVESIYRRTSQINENEEEIDSGMSSTLVNNTPTSLLNSSRADRISPFLSSPPTQRGEAPNTIDAKSSRNLFIIPMYKLTLYKMDKMILEGISSFLESQYNEYIKRMQKSVFEGNISNFLRILKELRIKFCEFYLNDLGALFAKWDDYFQLYNDENNLKKVWDEKIARSFDSLKLDLSRTLKNAVAKSPFASERVLGRVKQPQVKKAETIYQDFKKIKYCGHFQEEYPKQLLEKEIKRIMDLENTVEDKKQTKSIYSKDGKNSTYVYPFKQDTYSCQIL